MGLSLRSRVHAHERRAIGLEVARKVGVAAPHSPDSIPFNVVVVVVRLV